MNKREQKLCTQLGKWWDNEGHKILKPKEYKIEAKVSIGKAPFNYKSGMKPHQIPTLELYNTKPTHWKISDMDTISTKHYDIHFSHPKTTKALIAIQWVRPGNKTVYFISPDIINSEIESGSKSLTEKRAEELAFLITEVK